MVQSYMNEPVTTFVCHRSVGLTVGGGGLEPGPRPQGMESQPYFVSDGELFPVTWS